MTNEEKMAFWKGGDPSKVLRFTSPYDYEDCIVGVSTDGRAVYDLIKVYDYVCKEENIDGNTEEAENLVRSIYEMISRDLSFYKPEDKTPVFYRSDFVDIDDEKCINDSIYDDFCDCILGVDFRDDRYVFSLSKMVSKLKDAYGIEKEEAVKYFYSLKKAGTVENFFYNYIIVDDLYENISLQDDSFHKNNGSYSEDFEKDCIELNGKDFLFVIENQNKIIKGFLYPNKRDVLTHIQVKKAEDDDSKIILNVTDGKTISSVTLTALNKTSLAKPLYLHFSFVDFLISKISENDTVKLFEGNNVLFVKINDALYSSTYKELKYPSFERVIPANQPYSAEISTKDLKDFLDSIDDRDSLAGVYLSFSAGKLEFKIDGLEKSIPCNNNCPEGFVSRFSRDCLEFLSGIYKEKIIFEIKEPQTPVKVNQDNILTVFMPMKME